MTRRGIVIDIETAPDATFLDDEQVKQMLYEDWCKAPKNYTDDLKIAAARTEKWAEIRNGAALSPLLGRIRCIGVAEFADIDTGVFATEDEDERKTLKQFFAWLPERAEAVVTGFAIRSFDVPFISVRAALHSLEPPHWWPHANDYRVLADVGADFLWPRYSAHSSLRGKLSHWLARFGLEGKSGDGADAPDMPLPELIEYCRRDVIVERELARRCAAFIPLLRQCLPPDQIDEEDVPF